MASKTNPKSFLEELHRVAGAEAVAALCNACGGSRIYIPYQRVHRANSALALAYGSVEAANAIVVKLNGAGICRMNVNIPLGRSGLARSIQAGIREGLLAGHSVADVALANGITERTVYHYRRELVAEGKLSKRPS